MKETICGADDIRMRDPKTTAQEYLAESLPHQWLHTHAVAMKAIDFGERAKLSIDDQHLLTSAAWLHNIGHAPQSPKPYGFTALDSAALIESWGLQHVADLVAWHGLAAEEAMLVGLDDALAKHAHPSGLLADLLTYADLTTSGEGLLMSPHERFTEILGRYPPTHASHKGLLHAWPRINGVIQRAESALGQP